RGRADFRALMMDRGFPRDPFAELSPLQAARPRSEPTPTPAGAPDAYVGIGVTMRANPDGVQVIGLAPGSPAESDRRLRPGDTILGVEQVVSFAGKSPDEISPHLRGEAGTKVRVIVRPKGSDRREVYELTRGAVRGPAGLAERNTLDDEVAQRPDD